MITDKEKKEIWGQAKENTLQQLIALCNGLSKQNTLTHFKMFADYCEDLLKGGAIDYSKYEKL